MSTGHEPSGTPSQTFDPGLARDRTALAWTRSALSLVASGTLIARAAFVAGLSPLAIASAAVMAVLALLTWRHGRAIYDDRALTGPHPHHQTGALGFLTAATVGTAVVAVVVTVAI